MQRMSDEEPQAAVEKEPETVVGKQLSAMIKVRSLHVLVQYTFKVHTLRTRLESRAVLENFTNFPLRNARQIPAHLQYRGGPVTVAEYMREVLAHPQGGVYTARGAEAIGKQGHFITSPEISSLFGEVRSIAVCSGLHLTAQS